MVQFIQLIEVEPSSAEGRRLGSTPIIEKSSKEESANPLFGFSQNFVDNLQKITPLELGSAVPFVALRALDDKGGVIHDFNKELFFKQIDFSKINSGERYVDRPGSSLIELKIKSSTASGYIYFQDVTFQIKLHKPDITLNSTLIALLFPGMPMQLEYGWNSNSENETLNKKEKLNFALRSYNISYTQDGQIDLTIQGTAFNERFNNTLVGDEGGDINELLNKNLSQEQRSDLLRQDTTSGLYGTIENYQKYFKNVKENPDKSGLRDMKVVDAMMESYESVMNKARGKIRENFEKNVKQLKKVKQSGAQYKEGNNIEQELFKGKEGGMVTVHDLISTLCERTFDTLPKVFGNPTIRMVYGLFHNEVGKNENGRFKNQSIADFPIDLVKFRELVGEYTQSSGTSVLTIEGLFTLLISNFFHNEGYWKQLEGTKDGIRIPHMYLALNNYKVNKETIMDIALIDTNKDIPLTSGIIKDFINTKDGKVSINDFEKAIKSKAKKIPIIKLGHGNSFIRDLKMSNVMDEYIKAALIKRMADSSSTYTRSFIPPGLQNAIEGSDDKTPLHLPLQGTMNVLGNVDWKPFRAFGLISGIFPIDGLYVILDVEHTINNQGFFTNITFRYH